MASFNEHSKILKKIEEMTPKLNKLVDAAGVIAKNHFTKSFSDQGFTDESFESWKRRRNKDSRRGRQFKTIKVFDTDLQEEYKFRRKLTEVRSVKNRGILIKTGALRRSLMTRRFGYLRIKIISSLPYARVHNYGERAGRGKGFIMPKRQFVGYSESMNRKIVAKIDGTIKQIFKK